MIIVYYNTKKPMQLKKFINAISVITKVGRKHGSTGTQQRMIMKNMSKKNLQIKIYKKKISSNLQQQRSL